MATKAERSHQTRKVIIEEARKVFARDGFSKASLSEIVANSEVTTGAIYHHFGDKKGLFTAVAEYLEQQILEIVGKKIGDMEDGWERLEQGIYVALDVCSRADIQRIVFLEAPTVVGANEWREIEMKYAFGMMQETIQALVQQKVIAAVNAELTAQIILGTVIEAARAVAVSDNKTSALKEARKTVLTMLRAIRAQT